ncbi:MAG: phosphatase PAP2 family protein [Chlorobium sp.]|jgi:undecaprenyl-diphosphatase|nr:MAG: phosphatase PAP2 family protein [Chlorobium sp.]
MALIEQADVWLFQLLNLHLVHPAADDLMVFLTSESLSGHIYILAALFIAARKGREGVAIICLILLAVGLADFVASGLFKPFFQRVRPCYALEHVRLLINQPNSYSFASSHASNSAAAAVITWIFFHKGELIEKLFTIIMFLYALLIAFSRVYVGVHYPGDVLTGMVIGVFSAALVYLLVSWLWKNIIQVHFMRYDNSCNG